ncbi:ATP-dependent DNA helicase [Candidatus Palauibacter sp.]|uniref:ATP-dependent DNA helicase n=1 Tax=Candidatus Palauibacter sp. TaxID=3101350 RepID=UPI003B5BD046
MDGFLFPYQEVLALAEREGVDPEEFVAFAPDEHFEAYSYGSELLSQDGAVASLVACAATLHRIRERVEGPWQKALAWIDTQLNRLWAARGAFPGLGSALSAFGYEWGFQHGTLLAYEIELLRERQPKTNPWTLVDAVMKDPSQLDSPVTARLSPSLREGWTKLSAEKRSLLRLLSRCAISQDQALRFYDSTARASAGIRLSDSQVIGNPYLLFERDRRAQEPIPFSAVDRGMFPDEAIRKQFPSAGSSQIDDPADPRRVRAFVVDLLEEAAEEGHTLLPREWIIRRARERHLRPELPLGENVLDTAESSFGEVIRRAATGDGVPAYQVDRLVDCRRIIRREIRRRHAGRRHAAQHDWGELVDQGLDQPMPRDPTESKKEERARREKAEALEQLFKSRVSVLIGSAGTGKTTLLRMLCDLPDVADQELLLLAPTGKARVRLEEQTGRPGAGRTLAQFLNHLGRYDGQTGAYFLNPKAPRASNYRTVIVDECSMLTEEQLAALIDSLANVERLVLVGDMRQLPPIGAGRPFVDIVKELEPKNLSNLTVRCGPGYAELMVPRRQLGGARPDVLLASHFSGQPLDPGTDAVFDATSDGEDNRLRLVQWTHPQELQRKVIEEIALALELSGTDDELGFEESIGGLRHNDIPWAFFWQQSKQNPGAAAKAEAWQILSPVRAGLAGVDALNRGIQGQYRRKVSDLSQAKWQRKVPKPVGPQALLYGDKVINVINQRRTDVWPKPEGESYIANGDIGIVVGQYKTKKFPGTPWKLEVEWAGQLGLKYGFSNREFGDEVSHPLELAYSLTVHKTQGSEFGLTLVVLTNPCWLLSRELLYTALTRHQERLVVLHQGPLAEFRDYARDEHSEIARRMTNLFADPLPRQIEIGAKSRFLEDRLIHHTERGDLVQSKSELVIADKLYHRGIDYAYEQPLILPNGRTRYPDFTISDSASGVTFYWEHLGMYYDMGYRRRWEEKRAEYTGAGIVPLEDGTDSDRILIETRDEDGGGLDAGKLARLIDTVILG